MDQLIKQIFAVMKLVATDNELQFTSAEYQCFTKDYGLLAFYTSPEHPQSNGQVEWMGKKMLITGEM